MSFQGKVAKKIGIETDGTDVTVANDLAITTDLSVGGDVAVTGSLAVTELITITGVTTSGVTALIKNGSGMILLATGTTVPTDGGAGYAKGCLFIDTDVATGTTGLYVNVGTTAACNFDAVSDA